MESLCNRQRAGHSTNISSDQRSLEATAWILVSFQAIAGDPTHG